MLALQDHRLALTPCAKLVAQVLALDPALQVELDLGTTVLLTGCDDGAAVLELARRFPRSLFAGLDHSPGAINRARRRAFLAGRGNVWFEVGDITTHHFRGIFHQVVALDPAPPAVPVLQLLAAFHRSLRRQGTLFLRPATGMISYRLLEAGFAEVRAVEFADDPTRPVFVARR